MHCRFCLWFFSTKAEMQWILSFGIPHYSHSNTISDTDLVLLGLEPVILLSKVKKPYLPFTVDWASRVEKMLLQFDKVRWEKNSVTPHSKKGKK